MDHTGYDFPRNDKTSYERYPKLNWVYNRTRLFDAQNISWMPYLNYPCIEPVPIFTVETGITGGGTPATIYVEENTGRSKWTEVAMQKGEVKWIKHANLLENQFEDEVVGAVDIRISAFVTMYMQRYTGFASFHTIGSDIHMVRLRPTLELIDQYPLEAEKLFKKAYKKLPTP